MALLRSDRNRNSAKTKGERMACVTPSGIALESCVRRWSEIGTVDSLPAVLPSVPGGAVIPPSRPGGGTTPVSSWSSGSVVDPGVVDVVSPGTVVEVSGSEAAPLSVVVV